MLGSISSHRLLQQPQVGAVTPLMDTACCHRGLYRTTRLAGVLAVIETAVTPERFELAKTIGQFLLAHFPQTVFPHAGRID